MSITINDLAAACGAQVVGGDQTLAITSAADISTANPGQVTQLTSSRYRKYLSGLQASACFVPDNFSNDDAPETLALLKCKDPELAFVQAVGLLHPERSYPPGIAQQAVVSASAQLGANVHVGPFAVIGDEAVLGDHSVVLAGAYVGRGVRIGKHCRIHPYAVIYDDVVLGDGVVLHAGAVIGADGFGYKFREGRHVKVPQVGNVDIGDQVEIGANTCIDRGALGSTRIGQGSKIDNLVQIGHNNQLGSHVILCGQVGVSGSCQIGDYAILAGSAGIADHVNIGQGAVVMARAGVAGDVKAGAQVFGSPAKDKREAYKEQIALNKLPELLKRVRWLEERLQLLETDV